MTAEKTTPLPFALSFIRNHFPKENQIPSEKLFELYDSMGLLDDRKKMFEHTGSLVKQAHQKFLHSGPELYQEISYLNEKKSQHGTLTNWMYSPNGRMLQSYTGNYSIFNIFALLTSLKEVEKHSIQLCYNGEHSPFTKHYADEQALAEIARKVPGKYKGNLTFQYWEQKINVPHSMSSSVKVKNYSPFLHTEMIHFIRNWAGNLFLGIEELDHIDPLWNQLNQKFKEKELFRYRKIYLAHLGEKMVGVALVNRSSFALHLRFLENKTVIIVDRSLVGSQRFDTIQALLAKAAENYGDFPLNFFPVLTPTKENEIMEFLQASLHLDNYKQMVVLKEGMPGIVQAYETFFGEKLVELIKAKEKKGDIILS